MLVHQKYIKTKQKLHEKQQTKFVMTKLVEKQLKYQLFWFLIRCSGPVTNRGFGQTFSVQFTDNSSLALKQRVEEVCALVQRVLGEREVRGIREQRALKKREREAREIEEASRWPKQQEAITDRSQWLCEHCQRHCRVRFPYCSQFHSCHRCYHNSKACNDEEDMASHVSDHLIIKCSFCQHEQETTTTIPWPCCTCLNENQKVSWFWEGSNEQPLYLFRMTRLLGFTWSKDNQHIKNRVILSHCWVIVNVSLSVMISWMKVKWNTEPRFLIFDFLWMSVSIRCTVY